VPAPSRLGQQTPHGCKRRGQPGRAVGALGVVQHKQPAVMVLEPLAHRQDHLVLGGQRALGQLECGGQPGEVT
jgi:hypothetical protein